MRKTRQGVVTRSKKGTQNTMSSSTSQTPKSLVRIAHESLQVGQLLGVRITGNRLSAITRITRSLKNQMTKGRTAINPSK